MNRCNILNAIDIINGQLRQLEQKIIDKSISSENRTQIQIDAISLDEAVEVLDKAVRDDIAKDKQ